MIYTLPPSILGTKCPKLTNRRDIKILGRKAEDNAGLVIKEFRLLFKLDAEI